jgi:hypothetical protein
MKLSPSIHPPSINPYGLHGRAALGGVRSGWGIGRAVLAFTPKLRQATNSIQFLCTFEPGLASVY